MSFYSMMLLNFLSLGFKKNAEHPNGFMSIYLKKSHQQHWTASLTGTEICPREEGGRKGRKNREQKT